MHSGYSISVSVVAGSVWNLYRSCLVNLFLFVCFIMCFVLFVLFCFVLFCFVLFCFVLFCFVLFCFVLFCFVLSCFVLFCFVLCTSSSDISCKRHPTRYVHEVTACTSVIISNIWIPYCFVYVL